MICSIVIYRFFFVNFTGSIVVTFVISGSLTNVNTTAYSVCDSIYNNTAYSYGGYTLTLAPFLTINNQTYYGVECGEIVSSIFLDAGSLRQLQCC